MANGSFGLSGVPTAPTTLLAASTATTPLTAATVPVSTTTGFQANDLVYFRNGNFGTVPDGSTATATFPVSTQVSTYLQTQNNWQTGLTKVITGRNSGINTYLTSVGAVGYGMVQGRFNSVATLTNGNLIVVYVSKNSSNTGAIFASIFTEEGVLVTGPTYIADAGNNQNNAGVIALPNGNAVIWFGDAVTTLRWRFTTVSNTLTTVLAVTTIETATTGTIDTGSDLYCEAAARSDSSVAFYWSTSLNSNTYYKNINSTTGAVLTATQNVGTISNKYYNLAISVRPNDEVVLFRTTAAGANNLGWVHYSGTTVLFSGTITSNSNNAQWGNAVTLSDGRTVVSYINSTTGFIQYSIYNGSGTFATAVNWAPATSQINGPVGAFITPYTGGFTMTTFSQDTGQEYGFQPLVYNYNNSFVLQTTTSFTRCSALTMTNQYRTTVVKTENYFHLFCSGQLEVSLSYSYDNGPRAISWGRVSPTTMLNVPWTSITGSLGNTTEQSVFSYAKSNSTPIAAAFTAASTGPVAFSSAQTQTNATLIKQQTVIDSILTYAIDSCTLANGNVVFIYKTSINTVKCAVYNNQGVQLLIFNVEPNTSVVSGSSAGRQVSIAPLPNGNFVLSYYTTTATFQIAWKIYDGTTYAVIASGINFIGNQAISATQYATVSAYDNDRWVLAYNSTGVSYPYYEVRSSTTGALLASGNSYTGSATTNMNMVAGCGFIYFHGYTAAFGNWIIITIAETDVTNTFSTFTTSAQGGNFSFIGQKMRINQNGSVVYGYPTADTNYNTAVYTPGQFNNQNYPTNATISTGWNIGVTCNGDIVTAGYFSSTVLRLYMSTNHVYQPAGYTGSGQYDVTGVTFNGGTGNISFGMTPLFDNRMLLQWTDTNGYPSFVIINAKAFTSTTQLTAGVTVSNADLTLSPANGFYLTGVSTESASAGGTANIQVNGSVSLNSSYPSTTTYQAFDFSNPILYGVRGTIVGRNITMQGNL